MSNKILFEDLADIVPFDVDELIDRTTFKILSEDEIDVSDWYVHKEILDSDVLNKDFKKWLEDRNIFVNKVIIWHWLCSSAGDVAHIDSNPDGEVPTAALNWTANNKRNWVQFYDLPNVDKTVMFGNQAASNWKTDNVTSYIPVNIKGLTPDAVWDTRGPALLNIAEPHAIVAPEMRTTISIQFHTQESFEDILKRIKSV